jgi:glutamate dehydrogenase (NADP+)
MFGQYKRLRNKFTGALTGKGSAWGGSNLRPEATGYGLVYLSAEMLAEKGESFEGKRCLVSGSGNVAQYTAEKLIELGATVHSFSDSSGAIFDGDGIDREKLEFVMMLKNAQRGRIAEYKEKYPHAEYRHYNPANERNPVWNYPADCAFPCATQNEILEEDAAILLKNGVRLVAEGANMPTVEEGVTLFQEKGILYAPSKAANAGGVAVSGLEMAQNSSRMRWSREKVDQELQKIMKQIHKTTLETAERYSTPGNYVDGANIAGFLKVAEAMMDQGYV